jgi:CxxC motif-containing protein
MQVQCEIHIEMSTGMVRCRQIPRKIQYAKSEKSSEKRSGHVNNHVELNFKFSFVNPAISREVASKISQRQCKTFHQMEKTTMFVRAYNRSL